MGNLYSFGPKFLYGVFGSSVCRTPSEDQCIILCCTIYLERWKVICDIFDFLMALLVFAGILLLYAMGEEPLLIDYGRLLLLFPLALLILQKI